MKVAGRVIAGSLLGAGLVTGLHYVSRMRRMRDALVVVPKATLAKLNLDGLIIRVDAVLKNPTAGSFSMKFPFIKLLYKDTVVGSSQASNQNIKIPANGEARIENLRVNVPLESIFSLAASLLTAIKKKEPVKLKIEVQTELDLGLFQKFYQNTQEVVLAT
jgi:hypothetical protein